MRAIKLIPILLLLLCGVARATSVSAVVLDNAGTGFKWTYGGADNVCKAVIEDGADLTNGHQNAVTYTKYGCGSGGSGCAAFDTAWGNPTTGRFVNQGINTAGQYSYTYALNYVSGQELYVPTMDMGFYSVSDTHGYHAKNAAFIPSQSGMICGSAVNYGAAVTPDPFDPETATAINTMWSTTPEGPFYNSTTAPDVRYYIPFDGDSLFLIDSIQTHADGALAILNNSPVQASSAPSVSSISIGPCTESSTTVTCTTNSQALVGGSSSLLISGVLPSGYNGTFAITAATSTSITYTAASGLGSSTQNGTSNWAFTNATGFVKMGMADYLAAKYGCVGAGVSATATQSGYIATFTVTNSFTAGEMVVISGFTPSGYRNSGYPVLVMAQGLSSTQFEAVLSVHGLSAGSGGSVAPAESALVTTGTDPIGITSCGSTKIASALSSLNTAWGTSYTTFGTTDAGGLAGIANNTYTSTTWSGGTSTGLLDENGTHTLNSTTKSNCSSDTFYASNWGATTQIEADMHQFSGLMGAKIMQEVYGGYHAACTSNCPPLSNLIYDGPTEVYQQSAPFLDVLTVHVFYYATLALAVAEMQSIINNDGGLPVIAENYASTDPPFTCTGSYECGSTESQRGTLTASAYNAFRVLQNPLGIFAIAGVEHWMLYDWSNGSSNGITTVNDNYYDGSSNSTLASAGSWSASHTFTTPTIISDGTTNCGGSACHQALLLAGEPGQTCVSGGTAPTWAANDGQFTTGDGTCAWNNTGNFTITAESANSGDYILPVVNFFKGLIQTEPCEGAVTAGPGSTGIMF